MPELRRAETDDLESIVDVFMTCWMITYSNSMPDGLVDAMTRERAREIWAVTLAKGETEVLVAVSPEQGGSVSGVLHLSSHAAALGTSAFWALMAAGRYVAGALLRRGVPPGRYLILGLAAAAGDLAVAAWIGSSAPVVQLALAAPATASLAPGYALILGQKLGTAGDDAVQQLTGVLLAVGSAGGSVIPLVVALGVGNR
jgi:hypothetical protein